MKDPGRANVAMTRATQVFWTIGGPLATRDRRGGAYAQSAFPMLMQMLQENGQVIDFKPPEVPITVRRLTSSDSDGPSEHDNDIAANTSLQVAERAMGVACESIGTHGVAGIDIVDRSIDEYEGESDDAALFLAAVKRLRTPHETYTCADPLSSELVCPEESQTATEEHLEGCEGNYLSGPTDEERFFQIAGRLRRPHDALNATPRFNIAPEVTVDAVEVDVQDTGSDQEEAKFLALASRLRGQKV